MDDLLSHKKRSLIMAQIKSKNTRPEVVVRKFLHSKGFRYRLHVKSLPGKPDIVLSKFKTAIFIHGCFWHQHPGCPVSHRPKTNTEYWETKFYKNAIRDEKAQKELVMMGWRFIIIWECDIKRDLRKVLADSVLFIYGN